MQEAKRLHEPGDCKKHGAQPQDRKYVRRINHERIQRHCQNGGNGIHREKNVGRFNNHQHCQQWRGVQSQIIFWVADEEFSVLIFVGDRNPPAQGLDNRIGGRIDLVIAHE